MLSDPSRSKRTVRHPALPWQEMGAFMADLRKRDGIAAKAAELAILTACRSGEVRAAACAEFDLDAALWAIPAERMKAKREHRVPLSAAALAHSLPDKEEAAYRRGDLIEKRTLLMQAWADCCGRVPEAARVTPIRKAA